MTVYLFPATFRFSANVHGVFDHWFCEVPSQTFMNRSFWTAATSSGFVVNSPVTKSMTKNTAATLFERLEAHGKTWKVYVAEPMPLSFAGLIHFPRLQDRLATHFVPFAEFEPGGTYDHVAPGPVPPPDKGAPTGELGFRFDRSGYRVPAIIVSPWVEPGSVYNDEYRHTSLIATLRETWGLGEAFTGRDAAARAFDHVFVLETPRDPESWVTVKAQPVPDWTLDYQSAGQALSTLGQAIGPGVIEAAKKLGVKLPAELEGPSPEFSPALLVQFLRQVCLHIFPALAPSGPEGAS